MSEYRDETGLRVETVGKVDWVGYTGSPGPKKGTGKILAAPRSETDKRENKLPYSVIIAWDHLDGRSCWMPRDLWKVVE